MLDSIEFRLNLFTLVIDVFTWLIVTGILIVIIHYHLTKRLNNRNKIISILYIYIYLIIGILDSLTIIIHAQTYLGDMYETDFNSQMCPIISYILLIVVSMLYYGFVNQV